MNIKSICIRINDILAYIVLAILLVASAIVCLTTGPIQGLIFGGIGLIICSMLFGMWFVLSGLHDQAVKQTELLTKLLEEK